jgi:pantoate--beta-alanine ligase
MIQFTTLESISNFRLRLNGSVGLVPTMGALHDGHASLIRESLSCCDTTVVTIYVNPTQFSPTEDFDAYPRLIDADISLCKSLGVDAVFMPSDSDIYPDGNTTPNYTPSPKMTQQLCGISRPHFFKGVCNVVDRLFTLINPTHAFFGNKDLQQRDIIQKMVKDLNMAIKIIGCPIVRDSNGLALSSRNQYLAQADYERASTIYKALHDARQHANQQEWTSFQVRQFFASAIESRGLKGEYVEIYRPKGGTVINGQIMPGDYCCVAVICNGVRLIDNIQIK